MDAFTMGLFFAVFAAVMAAVGGVLKKKRAGSGKYQEIIGSFCRQVEAMLETGECVEAVCGYIPCAAVTNKRLLLGTKKGIDVVQFSEIKSLKGMNAAGNKTMNPAQMLVFEIKAGKKYALGNHSDGFDEVVYALMKHTQSYLKKSSA